MTETKKILIVIAPVNFRDEELFEPLKVFSDNHTPYEIASTKTGEIKGMLSGTANATLTLEEVSHKGCCTAYNSLLIVGGSGSPEYLWNNKGLHMIVRAFIREEKTVAAICLSPVVLAKAGILKDKNATVWPDEKAIHELMAAGAKYSDNPVVKDGLVITADGPKSATEFAKQIIKAIM
ncbi:DJ-1/PfpI family protein [Methanoplanus sp. FWC-SCC4]|uniref:DJ-1/PfpI family protein n=1 Tax=Methanochimaera problematica TaxID=2609417 RepID=A0AA97FCV2_9EURY|nr:DJ-1/PfpI family protein [Methanoplanus sp. FWC-SCC4]WOF16614.1 DJ-1/PfpI family protein [Methanoplanus sp. FWC-SCC4]